ncbi:MAG: M50 family metallopeptidase [Syntrophomonadaceae bacterium]|nr:M50 family metallopeptidase [Syntrophomonadaceae bacterium]MDD3022279.1 M50 family metallopeptidase [Syntrophomonadaceae bacterium]
MRLGRIAGVSLHLNLFLILLVAAYSYLGYGLEILIIFTSLLIHEIAHTIVALMLDIKVEAIELLPFGGQARIEDFTGLEPAKEIYMALAGPLISLSIAAFFYFLGKQSNPAMQFFITINAALGLFNLLPALPLDGGRVLRGILSPLLGYRKSTRTAVFLGEIIALVIIVYGLYLSYRNLTGANYLIMGVVLFWAARREGKLLLYSFMRFLVNKKGELAKKSFLPCNQVVGQADVKVREILNVTRPGVYMMVMVVDDKHQLISIKTEAELIECLLEKGPRATLRDC